MMYTEVYGKEKAWAVNIHTNPSEPLQLTKWKQPDTDARVVSFHEMSK